MTTVDVVQQILLHTDGTVTRILENYAGEPMRLVRLWQREQAWDGADPRLELPARQPVLKRRILLRGAQSDETFLYAESVIALDRLNAPIRHELLSDDRAIGILLRENRVETFREILSWGPEPGGDAAEFFGLEPNAPFLSRTYRIFSGGQPITVLTERFPADAFVLRSAAKKSL